MLNAFIAGDLFTAEKVLTQDITANAKNFASYANLSFIMARKFDRNNALCNQGDNDPLHADQNPADLDGFVAPCHTDIVA
jgi:hypothetical protein